MKKGGIDKVSCSRLDGTIRFGFAETRLNGLGSVWSTRRTEIGVGMVSGVQRD